MTQLVKAPVSNLNTCVQSLATMWGRWGPAPANGTLTFSIRPWHANSYKEIIK